MPEKKEKDADPTIPEPPKSGTENGVVAIMLPDGKLNVPSVLEHFGRDRFEELLGEFDWDAQLSDDGDKIFTFMDPRNQTGKANVTKDFIAWLRNEAAKPGADAEGDKEVKP